MPYSANCPTCGAPVVFKSSVSFHGVCEYCRSTLVRHGGNLESLGKMADLLEDASPIQLGTEGQYRGVHFAVIGRIQLRYAAGLWNEWHLLFDDMRGGWLSDANGEYVISFLKPPGATLPPFLELKPDRALTLAGKEFIVTDLEEAMCISGEGELPFAFGAGYAAQLVDLRAPDDTLAAGVAFASIDYSESPPLCFIGESLPYAGFRFANLRSGPGKDKSAGEVRALQCPSCAGPITLHDKAILTVACPSCLSILDAENASLKVLQKVLSRQTVEPLLPLGSVGRFVGKDWTIIGFQQRSIEPGGEHDPWDEYLLHHPTEGFRWLIESRGHWSWIHPLPAPPRYEADAPKLAYRNTQYVRFSAGTAVTRYVIGEFNWRVTIGEAWETIDFIAAPQIVSRESKENEITWSIGVYLSRDEVVAAFSLKTTLPEPAGVAANQPNPRADAHKQVCTRFWLFLLAACLAQAVWALVFGSKTLLDQQLTFLPKQEEPVLTKPFKLNRDARNIVMRHQTSLDNNWLGMQITLIEKNTGKAWATESEIAYWQGQDEDGDNWSEGSRERELIFRDVPAGEYYFVINPEISSENPVAVTDTIHIVRDQAAWSNFVLLLVFLAIFPLISRQRMRSFENERWGDADFLPNGKLYDDSGSDD